MAVPDACHLEAGAFVNRAKRTNAPSGIAATSVDAIVRRALQSIVLIVCTIAVASCISVKLVEDYDEKIDAGLNDYYEDAAKFIAQMSAYATDGNPAGQYVQNRQYYIDAGAQIDALLLRARANDPNGTCLGNAAGVVQAFLTKILVGSDFPEVAALRTELAQRPPGSCTVQVIYGVKINNGLMEVIHRRNVVISKTLGDILKDTVEQGVRIALTAELAKKRGE